MPGRKGTDFSHSERAARPPGQVQAPPLRNAPRPQRTSRQSGRTTLIKGSWVKPCGPGPHTRAQSPRHLPPEPLHSDGGGSQRLHGAQNQPDSCHPGLRCAHVACPTARGVPGGWGLPDLGAGPHGAVGEGSLALPDLLRQQAGQRREVHAWKEQRRRTRGRGVPGQRVQ